MRKGRLEQLNDEYGDPQGEIIMLSGLDVADAGRRGDAVEITNEQQRHETLKSVLPKRRP